MTTFMALMSQADFARHIGKTPGYVTQMKAAGRLVLQGRMINVDESVKLLAETGSPEKAAVTERHAEEREQKQGAPTLDELTGKAGSAYQQARAMKEKYNAMQAKIAYEKEVGILLVAADVRAAVADGDAIIRNRLESLPDILSPQLAAESDEQKIRSMLMDHVEQLLSELSRSFHNLTRQ